MQIGGCSGGCCVRINNENKREPAHRWAGFVARDKWHGESARERIVSGPPGALSRAGQLSLHPDPRGYHAKCLWCRFADCISRRMLAGEGRRGRAGFEAFFSLLRALSGVRVEIGFRESTDALWILKFQVRN